MTIRDTDPARLGEVILTRQCKIECEGEVDLLTLSFMRPTPTGEYVEGALRFECKHFDETLTVKGGDGVQVITMLLSVGKAYLQLRSQHGFVVWWHEKGDFDFFDFWSYQPRPTEYCLQSAYQDAASDAFTQANEGKVLVPSHRVAVEPDRPGITTYAVQADGSDLLAGFIGPEDMKGVSPDELCRRLGRMILNGSDEGRQLLDTRRGAKDYPSSTARGSSSSR